MLVSMNGTCISYSHVPHSTPLLLDYLYHFDRVSRFYGVPPYESSSYTKLATQIQKLRQDRSQICEILSRQNKVFGSSESTFANIDRLRKPETLAVVTGQQVGLFSGPAFTLYKALTAVRLAQSLTEQGIPTVPVFWLATEDHDLEEVASTTTFDDEYNLVQLKDPGTRPAPRSPVGYVKFTGESQAALDRLETSLPPGPPRDRLLRDLRETSRPGTNWGQAFGCFMARLFSRWGVILLDPLDDAVHRLSGYLYEEALRQTPDLRRRVLERSQALERYGYHAQVHVAEDSTLIFVVHEGNRLPIHQRNGDYWLDGAKRVSDAELQRWLSERPLDFSPNVLFRPVVQDMLLPTLAYVAGPSELAYLAQTNVLYEAFERPQPVVFPRAGFTLVDHRAQRVLEKYRLSVEDVWQGEEHLGRKIAAAGFAEGWSERFDQSERELAQLLERLRQDIEMIDPTLQDTLQHVKEKMTYQIERLRGKVTRAALSRSELLVKHQQALLRFLMPQKDQQERQVGGVYFLGRAGYELLDRLLSQIQVHCADHQVLKY
jgi:bacillithiol biosynthesis cysteine-adding enzyme BshC